MEDVDFEKLSYKLLIILFLPGILTYVGGWALFRLYLNEALINVGLSPIVMPEGGWGTYGLVSGYGRFVILSGISSVVSIFCIQVYLRRFKNIEL